MKGAVHDPRLGPVSDQGGAKFDHGYYAQKHMTTVGDRLKPFGLIRYEVDKGLAGGAPGQSPPYVAVCHLYFNKVEDFQKGIKEHAKEIMGDVPNYTTIQPVMQISEIVG